MRKLVRLVSILAFVLLSSTAVYAVAEPPPTGITTVPLATITNDRDASVSTIYAMLDDHDVFHGIYVATANSADNKPSRKDGHVYWLNAIESKDGVVLGNGQGVDAIFLRGDVESKKGQGTLVIQYLSNGILSSYDECRLGLRRVDPYDWRLIKNNQPVTHIKVQTWALGISTLTNVCSPS